MKKQSLSPGTTKALFEDQEIRRERYNDERWFSVVDIVNILSESQGIDKGAYRRKLKQRLIAEGSEIVTFCHELKFLATDGKRYTGDAANTQTVLRIIQSIPSPNAEPLKQRLASLGNQRYEELNDPELGMQRARERAISVYQSRGMNDAEIKQRLQTIDIRHDYTDELKTRGIQGKEYGILTNISYTRSGKNADDYKKHKGLTKNDNLRDHMTKTEMLLTGLSEEAGTQIIKHKDLQGFDEVQDGLAQGADIARQAKDTLEEKIGTSILDPNNRLTVKQQALRQKAHQQQKLGYNKGKKKRK
ncbi:MAG: phage antirepressor protein [candidate division SR1 bacterium]|nr:phage antirepressor protein [candidate division SR1 bacterium]